MKIKQLFIMVIAMVIVVGCSGNGVKKTDVDEVELMISAAASLTDALTDLKNTYEAEHDNVSISFNFGSSGKLATQIEQGAPSDIFLSASSKDMDKVDSLGLIDKSTRVDFTKNALVLIANNDSQMTIRSFKEIDPATISHLAVGVPESVPVGRYTKEVFEHLGLWEPLQSKLVMGSDVRQVLTHVEMGNADLGVVYSSDAFISDKVKVLAESDPAWHAQIVYPGAIVKNTNHQQAAQDFLDFLISEKGQTVFEEYGFK
ncbi:molybdate ABC transporter substrate-binding protein [Sporosarcina oncorhynchi]|uniref:Molybdate ABC transporter substrate-binding protein n=1 Tax=Sporosarcina oncorhynchi TaxID=3056444 RepID=A0ABZ0LA01_9BACL|nr:molybdate ABC transporter substrate-binding protein [Sporosarcina sp. T2O-4]WOV89009.1 molybdate ABC transporter substrate-binding protein [Sporosarcina sp. T2O-4]